MHGTHFTASFALLAVWCAAAMASPTGPTDVDGLVATGPFNKTSALTTEGAFSPLALGPAYNIDCAPNVPDGGYSNVCENWCYYAFCHQKAKDKNDKAWIVTVDRSAGMRAKSACGLSPNKCSVLGTGNPWPAAPEAGLSCDEQPKNTNSEGGPNAATRCMSASENSGEGAKWSNWINKRPEGKIADGTQLRVVLQNPNTTALCKSWYTPGTTVCTAPATPKDPDVKADAVRQQ
ncbi:hypothetical protein PsYK624_151510 [Phanerochaete sordida]|uniref:Deoxyribonuclease NucA/NucB domain-containing protein n=1 Tax=Phanerochaete sordida TaxID=48140 RepID=A0A9P3GSY5_9APHY|nr:hypothetical protein PsYK624_151510 [Phanerochaete sordida]